MKPKRLQRKRTRGYRLPAGAICVSRPSIFGNPFAVRERVRNNTWAVIDTLDNTAPDIEFEHRREAQAYAVARFIDYMRTRFMSVEELRGHDLACYCRLCSQHSDGLPLGTICGECDPCHGDFLLNEANR